MSRFAGKVVIVTGGASGIGRATAMAFAQEAGQVIVADVDEAGGHQTIDMIAASSGKACFIRVDVSQPEHVNRLVGKTVEDFGRLDVYFSNAGVLDGFSSCADTSNETWNRVLGVNLSGSFYGVRASLPHLAKTKGNIVITASIAALRGMAGGTAYTASKHGVHGLVNQVASECGQLGVRVNGVAPGPIRTNIAPAMKDDPKIDQWIRSMTALGRWGMPEEVAKAVLFLASDEASFITGSLLRVDGGWGSK